MGIEIVSSQRDFTRTISGVDFSLRRLTEREEAELRRQHLRRGEVDMPAYTGAKLRAIVKGWGPGVTLDGVENHPFDPALVWELPDSVKSEIFEAVNEGRPTKPPAPRSGGI